MTKQTLLAIADLRAQLEGLQLGGLRCIGIKCDACLWRDDSAELGEMPLWLNVPCPACGANLLTFEDLRLLTLIQLAWKGPGAPDEGAPVRLEMDGSGIGRIKVVSDER